MKVIEKAFLLAVLLFSVITVPVGAKESAVPMPINVESNDTEVHLDAEEVRYTFRRIVDINVVDPNRKLIEVLLSCMVTLQDMILVVEYGHERMEGTKKIYRGRLEGCAGYASSFMIPDLAEVNEEGSTPWLHVDSTLLDYKDEDFGIHLRLTYDRVEYAFGYVADVDFGHPNREAVEDLASCMAVVQDMIRDVEWWFQTSSKSEGVKSAERQKLKGCAEHASLL